MRTLLLMRHAKSSWKNSSLEDEDRPLNGRGKRDAKRMGEFLRKRGLVPDLVLTSPAKRARQTAKRVRVAGDFDAETEKCPELYFAGGAAYIQRIAKVADSVKTLLVIGHNPDLETMLQRITGNPVTMPTGAVARLELKAGSWDEILGASTMTLRALYRPKDLPSG